MSASIDWNLLRDRAIEVMKGAYVPYSRYPVGAAALVDDGRIVTGCNVENVSYGLGLCAECTLAGNLHVSGGGRLVALSCTDSRGQILMPCGRCRQVLLEHGGDTMLIDHRDGPKPLGVLLPDSFGPADLEAGRVVDGGVVDGGVADGADGNKEVGGA
ncbi:cytidine deaminase [Williamsia sp. R60]